MAKESVQSQAFALTVIAQSVFQKVVNQPLVLLVITVTQVEATVSVN